MKTNPIPTTITEALSSLDQSAQLFDLHESEFVTGGSITNACRLAGYDESGRIVVNNLNAWNMTVAEFSEYLTPEPMKFELVATSTTPTLRAEIAGFTAELYAPADDDSEISNNPSVLWELRIIDRVRDDVVYHTGDGKNFEFVSGDDEFDTDITDSGLWPEINAAVESAIQKF